MAHHVEPMDIDSDFDNKENSLHHNNVLPFTEKGYEELDVSELNMKLRYSVTPASSPMSKSFTATCTDDRSLESGDDSLNITVNENCNLSHSLSSTLTKNDNIIKSLKALPLQTIPTEQFVDSNRNTSVLRPIDTAITPNNGNITVTVHAPSDIDENLSLPSSSSSALHTPEATTPTKDIPLKDGDSPIMRGLKSVLNMFRSSQSPIPPSDNEGIVKQEMLSPEEPLPANEVKSQVVLASTPIASHRKKEMSPTKRSSPQKDSSIVFNEDLEKELQWKDEATIIFSQERIPIHKVMLRQPQDSKNVYRDTAALTKHDPQELNTTVEYMDISYNDSFRDRTVTEIQVDNAKADATFAGESDSEFVDCETTFTNNKSPSIEDNDKTVPHQTSYLDITKQSENKNDCGSRLKQIILNSTQDILDATLSVRPEDLLPEIFDQTQDMSDLVLNMRESLSLPMNQTVDIINTLVLGASSSQSADLDCTKTIEVTSATQPVKHTFDAASSLINEKNEINSVNVSKTLENILGVTQTLENNESDDPNCSKNIEASTTTQTIDKTFEAANSLINEEQQKENLDVTKTKENNLGVTQILENNELQDFNHTKTNQESTTTQIINQTFDAAGSLIKGENQKDNLDGTQSLENILGVTQILENQTNIAETCTQISNTTVVLDDNKNFDTIVNSTIENVDNENNELAPEFVCKDSVTAAEIPVMPAVSDAPIKESIIKLLPIPDDIDISTVQDVTMTELPVDIPLPDEDDLEKELIMPIDTTPESTPPVSLPLDLVDNIKITTSIYDTINTTIEGTKVNLNETSNTHKNNLPELSAPLNISILEGGDRVNDATIENDVIETVKYNPDNAEQINTKNEMSELCKEIKNTNLLPEVTTSNIIKDEEVIDKEEDKYKIENTNNEINVMKTVSANKPVEQVNEDVIHNQAAVYLDNNKSASELKPLPDIINQTIVIYNNENLHGSPSVAETVNLEKVESNTESEDKSNSERKNTQLDVNVIDSQMTCAVDIEHVDSINEINKDIEEKSSVVATRDANLTQELSDMTPGIADNEISGNEICYSAKVEAISTESKQSAIENFSSSIAVEHPLTELSNTKEIEEEIVISENNSPFVSVIADNILETQTKSNAEIESVDNSFATKIKVILAPPTSPPIRSKGYNFNFDDINFDPFTTKTNIRMSPPFESPNKTVGPNAQDTIIEKPVTKKDMNRQKSQTERKKPTTASKRKFNATFDGKINYKVIEKSINKHEAAKATDIQLDSPATIVLNPNSITIEEKIDQVSDIQPETVNINEPEIVFQDKIDKPIESSSDVSVNSIESNLNELQPISSSEQSTYFSAGGSSSESLLLLSRNVFNLPEIDDANFNPFATKSKMRQSPPPDVDIDNHFDTKSKVMSASDLSMTTVYKINAELTLCEDKIETESMEKDASDSLSNVSKTTDEENVTTKEIHTEDEDTIEGPFLETEDINPDAKISDFGGDNIDILQFSDLPPQSSEENLDNGEMFIDAEAFEFLLNQNKSNTVADSGKESLFLKFDPLFAKRMSAVSSDGVRATLAKLQKPQNTPTKAAQSPPKSVPSPVAGPSNLNVTQDIDMNMSEEFNDDLNITVSKPMMVVPPAVNPVTPRNKSLTPNRSNRRSITFTSPAMAVIDRLLSLSSNNSLLHDMTVTHVSREQNEADIALSQLQELLAEKEINVYNLKCESNELRDRLNTLEGHVKSLEAESEDRLKKINQLTDTLVEKTKINKSMAAVVEEYERTIASLIAETAQDKKRHAEERIKLINERDEQTAHLASMEVSFSDLHSKYEKSKQLILSCKANEDQYKKSIKEFEENVNKMHNNYELLKQHATSKLNHANLELEKINRSHEAEILKLNAMIKRKELHISSLEESLAQKTKANDELTAICDELINKVG